MIDVFDRFYPLYSSYRKHLPWKVQKFLPPPTLGQYHVISRQPLIIIIPEDIYEHKQQWNSFFRILQKRKVHFLCRLRCTVEQDDVVKQIKNWTDQHCAKHPDHSFIYLANTVTEEEKLKANNLKSVFVNQNCFIDEKIFQPQPGTPKLYDAIYNARTLKVKNHHLASQLDNLALIMYFATDEDKRTFSNVKRSIPHAIALNWPGTQLLSHCEISDYVMIEITKIPYYLNRANVGLCLSTREGAMYASTEYLLCDLPVVSTKSVGGRDVMFEDEYVKIVESDSQAVKNGVQEILQRNIPPGYIRTRVLSKMEEHRKRFIDLVQDIYDQEGINRTFAKEWKSVFMNRMFRRQDLKLITKYLY